MTRTLFDRSHLRTGRARREVAPRASIAKVERLSRASVGRGVDAFADIGWDDPEMDITPGDPRMRLPAFDPLSQTAWYRNLDPVGQARVGAWRSACALRMGCDFENLLQQGLLRRALSRRGDPAEVRYTHHENIEESQHTMMFNEFIRRTGTEPRGMPAFLRLPLSHLVPFSAVHDPAMFWLLVLTGEEPVDRYQRNYLADGNGHPLLSKVMRAHIADESRHVAFARLSLAEEVARMGWLRRQVFAAVAPLALWVAALVMLLPSREMAADMGEAYSSLWRPFFGPEGHEFFGDMLAKPRQFSAELGLMTPAARRVWKAVGIA